MKYIIVFALFASVLFFSCQESTFSQGEQIYNKVCGQCHMEDGSGLGKNIPPLANSDYLKANMSNLSCIIRHGIEGEIVVNGVKYNQQMQGVKGLSEIEMANVINYLDNKWGNKGEPLSMKDVVKALEKCGQ